MKVCLRFIAAFLNMCLKLKDLSEKPRMNWFVVFLESKSAVDLWRANLSGWWMTWIQPDWSSYFDVKTLQNPGLWPRSPSRKVIYKNATYRSSGWTEVRRGLVWRRRSPLWFKPFEVSRMKGFPCFTAFTFCFLNCLKIGPKFDRLSSCSLSKLPFLQDGAPQL